MPVQELENLRQKYPQYNGIDDMTLATKLAGKYPQYGFILDKVKAENPQGESGDDWMSKSFPKMARNNLSKLYQGGANSPANVKARHDVQYAQSRDNPINNTLKGLADAGQQTTNPFNSIVKSASGGDSGKSASDMAVDFAQKNKFGTQDTSVMKLAGDVMDMATTPANIIGGKILESGLKIGGEQLPTAGKATNFISTRWTAAFRFQRC